MNIVYVHGLDSDANSTKGLLLEGYCEKHHPDITIHRPDLNQSPQVVFDKLVSMINSVSGNDKVVLVGSSLGGYFATLVSNQTGCPALLINPSTQPHITLQRFDADKGEANALKTDSHQNKVLHTTDGGWALTKADLQWFTRHTLSTVENPSDVEVMIKKGDELLDANLSAAFYRQQGATVTIQAGGDHRFSDFEAHLSKVLEILKQL